MNQKDIQELRELADGADERVGDDNAIRVMTPTELLRKMATALRACADREERAQAVADAVPTTWLDPLLTGSKAVIGKGPYTGTDIENLLRAVKDRVQSAALALQGDRSMLWGLVRDWQHSGLRYRMEAATELKNAMLKAEREAALCLLEMDWRHSGKLLKRNCAADLSRAIGDSNER